MCVPITSRPTVLEQYPLGRAAELLAVRHRLTAEQARWRLYRIAAFVNISDREQSSRIIPWYSRSRPAREQEVVWWTLDGAATGQGAVDGRPREPA